VGVEQLPTGIAPTSDEAATWATTQLAEHWGDVGIAGVDTCPDLDKHLRARKEIERLQRKVAKQQNRTARRQGALVAEFDAVAEILHERGFAHDWYLNAKGDVLTNVHGEAEAVLAEAIDQGVFHGLTGPELAAALSALVYETRGKGRGPSFRWPTRPVRKATMQLQQLANALRTVEQVHLDEYLTREPDPGLVEVVYNWALGDSLDELLWEDATGGDFVRSMRQVVDVCRQVASVTEGDLRESARDAVHAVDRGVVRGARDLVPLSDADEEE